MLLTPRQLIDQFNTVSEQRKTWEYHWQECADYILPRKNTITNELSPGQKRNTRLLDNTAVISNDLLAGALHGLLTNPHSLFFELTTGDKELDDRDEVREWLQDSTVRMHNVLNNSNFQTEVHEVYIDLGTFGTAAQFIAEDPERIVRFNTIFIKEFFIEENNLGYIDTVYRLFKWNAKQIVQEFGAENVHKQVLDALNRGDKREFEIIHAVYPQKIQASKGRAVTRFFSQYVLRDTVHQLRIRKLREFPYVVTRWTKASGEVYGRSPGMAALPEAKTVNRMDETVLKGAQKVVDPPLQVPDDGFVMPIRTRPASINIYRSGTQDRIEPIFNDTRIDFGFQALEDRRRRIREAFYVDQLRLREGPQMTATEVEQRVEEAMRFLGPILGRQENEYLRPLIDRVFAIMLRRNLFKPIPEALSGRNLDVQYSSLIAKAQRINQGRNILRGFDAMTPFLQLDPNAVDIIDSEGGIKELAKIYGWPGELLKNADEIEQIRSARAEAQQAQLAEQQKMQDAEVVAKVGPTMVQSKQTGT